jgi:bacteriorhodopsin
MKARVKKEGVIQGVRQFALHSSAAGFSLDFAHCLFGRAMILLSVWESYHEFAISYAAFAATLVVYCDGYKEKVKAKGKEAAA